MAHSKSTPKKTAKDLGLTPHEERLLKGYFRQQTRPYLIGLLIGASALGVLFTVGVPGPRPDEDTAATEAAQQVELAAAELRNSLDVELAAVRVQLETLEATLAALEKDSGGVGAKARKRLDGVDSKLSRLNRRLDAVEEQGSETSQQLSQLGDQLERKLVDAALGNARGDRSVPAAGGEVAAEPAVTPASDSDLAFE